MSYTDYPCYSIFAHSIFMETILKVFYSIRSELSLHISCLHHLLSKTVILFILIGRKWWIAVSWIDYSALFIFMQHAYLVRYLYILVVIMANLKKDPLGLDLELNVTDGDLEGLDYDLRPPFVNGIGCPVPECGTHAYTSITSLWKHWSKFHRRHIVMFLCGHDSCTFKSPTKGLVLKHKRRLNTSPRIKRRVSTT